MGDVYRHRGSQFDIRFIMGLTKKRTKYLPEFKGYTQWPVMMTAARWLRLNRHAVRTRDVIMIMNAICDRRKSTHQTRRAVTPSKRWDYIYKYDDDRKIYDMSKMSFKGSDSEQVLLTGSRWLRRYLSGDVRTSDVEIIMTEICMRRKSSLETLQKVRTNDYVEIFYKIDDDGIWRPDILRNQALYEFNHTGAVHSDIFIGNSCECCGSFIGKAISPDGGWFTNCHVVDRKNNDNWTVCRRRVCRYIAHTFPRGRSELPLIRIINEVTKYDKSKTQDNPYKRGLEKYFVRHA